MVSLAPILELVSLYSGRGKTNFPAATLEKQAAERCPVPRLLNRQTSVLWMGMLLSGRVLKQTASKPRRLQT